MSHKAAHCRSVTALSLPHTWREFIDIYIPPVYQIKSITHRAEASPNTSSRLTALLPTKTQICLPLSAARQGNLGCNNGGFLSPVEVAVRAYCVVMKGVKCTVHPQRTRTAIFIIIQKKKILLLL